jgi:hypothetical protein
MLVEPINIDLRLARDTHVVEVLRQSNVARLVQVGLGKGVRGLGVEVGEQLTLAVGAAVW